MPITHAFTSAKSDGADATLVQPGDWNAAHLTDPASSIVAAAAIANTETVVTSITMPLNTIAAGTTFRAVAYGRLTSGGTPGSSIFRVRIGTTTLTGNIPATLTILNGTSKTNAPFRVEALVTVRTSGTDGAAIGEIDATEGVAVLAFGVVSEISAVSATVVVDTTATKRVELTYISGNSGTTATFEVAAIEIVKP